MKKLSVMLAAMSVILTACVQNPSVVKEETTSSAPETPAVTTTTLQTASAETVATTVLTTTKAVTTTVMTVPTTAESVTVPSVTTTAESVTTAEPEDVPPLWATGTRATEYEGEPFARLWLDKTSYPQNFDYITVNYDTIMDGLIHFDYSIEKWTDGKWGESDEYHTANESFEWSPPKSRYMIFGSDIYPSLTPGKYRIKAELYTYMKAEDFIDDGSEYTVNENGYRTNYYYLEFEITE